MCRHRPARVAAGPAGAWGRAAPAAAACGSWFANCCAGWPDSAWAGWLRSAGRSGLLKDTPKHRRNSPGRCRNGWPPWHPAPVHRLRSPVAHGCGHGASPSHWPARDSWHRWAGRSRSARRGLLRRREARGAGWERPSPESGVNGSSGDQKRWMIASAKPLQLTGSTWGSISRARS